MRYRVASIGPEQLLDAMEDSLRIFAPPIFEAFGLEFCSPRERRRRGEEHKLDCALVAVILDDCRGGFEKFVDAIQDGDDLLPEQVGDFVVKMITEQTIEKLCATWPGRS